MLSDEEMKAIEDLKDMIEKSKDLMEEEFYKLATIHNIQAVATILNLIKKQQKEIEELNEENNTTIVLEANRRNFDRVYNLGKIYTNKKWKDKIKEICQKKRNQIFSCTYVDEKQWKPFDRAIDAINDLEQSLLEKET